MPIIATNKKSDGIEPIEAGSYPARIYQMVQIGTVEGFEGKMQNKVRVTFELPTETHVFDESKGPQPRVISKEFTLSFNEKATLTKLINAADPSALKIGDDGFMEEFDVTSLVGKPVLITITHRPGKDGKVFANADGFTRLPKGMECPPQVNPSKVLSYDSWDEEFFQSLPDFIREKMAASPEYKAMRGVPSTEEVPF